MVGWSGWWVGGLPREQAHFTDVLEEIVLRLGAIPSSNNK